MVHSQWILSVWQCFKLTEKVFYCMYIIYLHINLLSDIRFSNIFSHPFGYIFTVLIINFDAQMFVILIKFSLSTLALVACTLNVISRKPRPTSRPQESTPVLSSENFIILSLTFSQFSHFKFTFVSVVR